MGFWREFGELFGEEFPPFLAIFWRRVSTLFGDFWRRVSTI